MLVVAIMDTIDIINITKLAVSINIVKLHCNLELELVAIQKAIRPAMFIINSSLAFPIILGIIKQCLVDNYIHTI
jgi:hypothetical protein